MDEHSPDYESPSKKQLEDILSQKNLSPKIRAYVEDALARLDHTNPAEVLKRLPLPVLGMYQGTLRRAAALTPLIKKAHESGCYIESLVLSHGLIQLALRALYVLAWQRTILPKSLSETDLASLHGEKSKRGSVFFLVQTLEANGLLFDHHAALLREVNDYRNRAAHGVIIGEIDPGELREPSEKAQNAAAGAIDWLRIWFNNPRPLAGQPKP